MKKRLGFIVLVTFHSIIFSKQPAIDTLLFSITLTEDTTSIYGCLWNDQIQSTLAGPVIMAGNSLLFYSKNGYVLYNEKGKQLDSYSLISLNNAAKKKGEPPFSLAYPLDSTTLIIYKKSPEGTMGKEEIYLKKLYKKELKKVYEESQDIYNIVAKGHIFNLAANSMTDEMGSRNLLKPQLVGYTAIEGGIKWWSIDRLYSFTSPLIVEENGVVNSFFPGLKSDQKCEIQSHRIEPLGVYQRDGRWYYWGLASSIGNTEDEYYQMLILCDQAGNLLYSSKLLKQEISDAVLQYVERTNTNYTVRKAVRHVFVPAVDRKGNIFYGIINFEHKKLEVYKRTFLWYKSEPAKKSIPTEVFEKANLYAYSPVLLDCTEDAQQGVFPEITILTDDGIKTLSKNSLVKKGYYLTLHRITDMELKKKLSRIQELLPSNIRKAQDSIAKMISSWCPYSISLNHEERGRLNIFHYSPNDELLSARILAVTENSDIIIRVDLEKWAEVVMFDGDGEFVNRFIFNRQDYNIRKDLIVVGKNSTIAEEDYELPKGRKQYLLWKLMIDK